MNKKLLAIAVAAFVAAPAIASAQTTLFGQFKYEVGYIDSGFPTGENVDGDPTYAGVEFDNNFVHSTKGTRIGLHGSEDLGGGLQAIYRFQGGMGNVNSGVASSSFALNEENWVGVQGGFGTLQLGRSDTAMKKTGGNPFRAFTDTLAEPSVIPVRTGRADGIHYTSPNIAGFTGYLTVEPNGVETDAYFSVGASYAAGPFLVTAAVEQAPDTGTYSAGINDVTNYQVGAKWNFGQGDVGLLYQMYERRPGGADPGDAPKFDTDVFVIPVNYKVTPNVNLRAAVLYADPDVGDDFTNFALGAQYMFSNRTEAFVNVWVDDAERQTLTPGNNGPQAISTDSTQFGFGLRHSF